jgi:hypothetical protein
MTAAVREIMIEAFGDQGEAMYQRAQEQRDRAAKLAALQGELEQTRALLAADIGTAAHSLAERQREVDAAYVVWLASCRALEGAKTALQQRKMALRDGVQAIIAEMHPSAPAPLVTNWTRPGWFKPESEIKGGKA